MDVVQEFWRPGRSVPIRDILFPLRRGTGDPSMVLSTHDIWWAVQTPRGPAATWWSVRSRPGVTAEVRLEAYGPGASWFTGRLPSFLGSGDAATPLISHHERVTQALRERRHQDWRVPRTTLVMNSLVPSILEQKVTGKQAFAGYRYLLKRHGSPVTFGASAVAVAGASAARVARLVAPPTASGWRRIPSWEWLQAGVEPPQSRTVMRACEVAPALEASSGLPLPEAHRRLRSVPGIGVWTAAKVAQTAWGDADAPTFADYHIAKLIGHAVLGRDTDDAGMARILEPYRGQRYRAEHLLLASGGLRERRGHRMSLPQHLPNRAV